VEGVLEGTNTLDVGFQSLGVRPMACAVVRPLVQVIVSFC
jgi:hypothetical protein